MVRLHTMHEILGLPAPARRHAEAPYVGLAQDGFTAGRTAGGVMAASAYVACQELGIPRTLRGAATAGSAAKV